MLFNEALFPVNTGSLSAADTYEPYEQRLSRNPLPLLNCIRENGVIHVLGKWKTRFILESGCWISLWPEEP